MTKPFHQPASSVVISLMLLYIAFHIPIIINPLVSNNYWLLLYLFTGKIQRLCRSLYFISYYLSFLLLIIICILLINISFISILSTSTYGQSTCVRFPYDCSTSTLLSIKTTCIFINKIISISQSLIYYYIIICISPWALLP